MTNKIVVKFKDGKIVKGWSTDFVPNKEIFHLHPLEEYGKDILEIERIDSRFHGNDRK